MFITLSKLSVFFAGMFAIMGYHIRVQEIEPMWFLISIIIWAYLCHKTLDEEETTS